MEGNSIWQTNFLQLSRLINSRISIWLLQPDKHFPVLTVEQVFQSMDCSRSKFRTRLTNSLVNFDRLWKTFQPFLPGFVASSSSSSSYFHQHVQMFRKEIADPLPFDSNIFCCLLTPMIHFYEAVCSCYSVWNTRKSRMKSSSVYLSVW